MMKKQTKPTDNNNMKVLKDDAKKKYVIAVQTEEFAMKKTADSNKINENSRWAREKFRKLEKSANLINFQVFKIKSIKLKAKAPFESVQKYMPFYKTLRSIESTYGLSYMGYFNFIRWLFVFYFVIGLLTSIFIVMPQKFYGKDDLDVYKNESFSLDSSTNCTAVLNDNSTTSDKDSEYQYVSTKCCVLKYKNYVEKNTKDDTLSKVFDVFQGTGFLEDNILFYGSYGNRTSKKTTFETLKESHVYFMGLAFMFITFLFLLVSAIFILLRLGKGFKTSVIRKLESQTTSLSNRVFSAWDYRIINEKTAKYHRNTFFNFFNKTVVDEIERKKYSKLTSFSKKILLFRRIFGNLSYWALIGLSAWGFVYINEFSNTTIQKEKDKGNDFNALIVSYAPAAYLTLLNWIFTYISRIIGLIEKYSLQARAFWFLLRMGFVRLGTIIFLFISVTIKIFQNKEICASQISSPLNQFFSTGSQNTLQFTSNNKNDTILCWETYVGQQFYRLVLLNFITQIIMTFFVVYPCGLIADKIPTLKFLKPEFNLNLKFLDLLYIQTIFWSGFFFCPFLAVIAVFYYFLMFYNQLFSIKFSCNLSEDKAEEMKSDSASYVVLFIVFLFVLFSFGLVISVFQPSRSCGPFRLHDTNEFFIYKKLNDVVRDQAPELRSILDVLFNYLFILGVCVLLLIIVLIFYNYWKAYYAMMKTYSKIVLEERKKNNSLAKKVDTSERLLKTLMEKLAQNSKKTN